MAVYSRQVQSALRMIALKGMGVTFRKIQNGAPENSLLPWKPGQSINTDYPVNIVFLPTNRIKNEFSHYSEDKETSESSEIGLMGAVDFSPAIKDIVIRGSEELAIKYIDRLAPNGEVILYTLHFEH